jgi:hypothetical protein
MLFSSRLKMASVLLSGIMSIVSKTVHIFNHSDKPANDRNLLIYAFMGTNIGATNDLILHSPEISLVISCSHWGPCYHSCRFTNFSCCVIHEIRSAELPKSAHGSNQSRWYSLEFMLLYWPQVYSILMQVKKYMTRL